MSDAILTTNITAGDAGHPAMHAAERARLNAFAVLPAPYLTAAQNVAKIAEAIAAVTDAQGRMGMVTLGAGVWKLNGTIGIELRGKFGGVLQGVGETTRLVWEGDANGSVVKVAHCQRMTIRHLFIGVASAANLAIWLLRDNTPNSTPPPTKNVIEHVYIDGRIGATPNLIRGIHLGDGADANNDFNVFRDVQIEGYTEAAWELQGSQSYGNEMYDCHANGNGTGKYGIKTRNGGAATFSWYGGSVGGHSIADFLLTRAAYFPFRIAGVNSENSECFIDASSDEAFRTIIVDGCRWAGNTSANHAIMKIAGRNHVTVENCHFGDGGPSTQPNVIDYQPVAGTSYFRFNSNLVFSSAETVFTESAPDELNGNEKITHEGNTTIERLTS